MLKILSIDGGGIRGIIPGVVLRTLEEKLKARDPDATLASTFDLFAGTSTGGIIVCMLLKPDEALRPAFTASDAVDLYVEQGPSIFRRTLFEKLTNPAGLVDEQYSAAPLEAALKERLGEDTKLSHLLKPCLLTAYDLEERTARFFTSHTAKKAPKDDYPLWQVARATSAAPTYFECARIRSRSGKTGVPHTCVDGGVFANNPAMCAFAEARKYLTVDGPEGPRSPTIADLSVLSLGTGTALKPYAYDDVKDWGAATWVQPIIDILMTGVSETVDVQLRRMFEAAGEADCYTRLQADLRSCPPETDALDNVHPDNLSRLVDLGQKLADDHDDELERWADRLTGKDAAPVMA